MKKLILFDQDTQHYRQSIYRYFEKELTKIGYKLIVVYDNKLNKIIDANGLFIGINYSFISFNKIIRRFKCKLIIQFVWLRYKFLIPFMIYNQIKGVKLIVWSHGINLQKKNQIIKNQFYYLRQLLADALIVYTPDQKKHIKVKAEKIFVANNTINFNSLPRISLTKDELKSKYNLKDKKVILCVGRLNTNNRKVNHLIKLSELIDSEYKIIVIGPGVDNEDLKKIESNSNIEYLGAIYDQRIISAYYKLSDIFVMPGAIGLAINQAFYFHTPVLVENVDQGPEAYYLKNGINGYFYEANNIKDLYLKLKVIMKRKNYYKFSNNAKKTIRKLGNIELMYKGFKKAIKYAQQ